MDIVDSHCHLDLIVEKGQDLDRVIDEARTSNVNYIQTIATSIENFKSTLSIAKKYDKMWTSVGVHPCNVGDNEKAIVTSEELIDLSRDDKVIGLGETGLDHFHSKEPSHITTQIKSFENHIAASKINKLPLIVHTRDADELTANIIKENMNSGEFPALIHCFTASEKFAWQMLDLGLYISISGIITFKNALDLHNIVRKIPLDRLLVETDAPYLSPVPFRGKLNEPAYTKYVVEYIASLKNISAEEVAKTTTDNFFKLFTKAQR